MLSFFIQSVGLSNKYILFACIVLWYMWLIWLRGYVTVTYINCFEPFMWQLVDCRKKWQCLESSEYLFNAVLNSVFNSVKAFQQSPTRSYPFSVSLSLCVDACPTLSLRFDFPHIWCFIRSHSISLTFIHILN